MGIHSDWLQGEIQRMALAFKSYSPLPRGRRPVPALGGQRSAGTLPQTDTAGIDAAIW